MKRKTMLSAAVAMLSLLTGGVAAAQEFVFKLHHFLGAKSPSHTRVIEPWARAVEENSGGRVKIEIFPAMSLGGRPPELIEQARDGVVDLIWVVNGYTPGLFPRTEVAELPYVEPFAPAEINLALADIFDEHLRTEYAGLEVMFLHVHTGQAIQTRDKLVRAPKDFEGLRLRTPSRTGAWVIEMLDAIPAPMPLPDLPLALQNGKVDGALIPFEIIPPLQIQNQTTYHIEGAGGARLGNTTFQLSMTKARWDALPEDIQKAFRDASGPDWLAQLGAVSLEIEAQGLKAATDAGNMHIVLTEEETDAMRLHLEPVLARWVADIGGLGANGSTIIEDFLSAAKTRLQHARAAE